MFTEMLCKRVCISTMCLQLCVGNMWLSSYRLKNVKWWPPRKSPCGLSLNVPTLQLCQMKQLELSLNTATICARTCWFYRCAAVKEFFFSYLKQEFCTRSKKMPSTDPVPFSYFVWWTVIKGDIIEFSLGEYSRGPLDTKSSEPHSSVHSWGDAYPAFPNSQMHFPALTSFLYNAFLVWQHGIETYFTPKYPLYS